jgi:hypothetical protein
MSSLSLISIMRDDPDIGVRLKKKVEAVKKNKEDLLAAADDYGKQYQNEILEGTQLRAKLLTEGSAKGLSEDQIMSSYGRFVPTVYTPILNMLFFLLRESEPQDSRRYRQRDVINEALIKAKQLNHDDNERDLTSEELVAILDEKLKELNEQTGCDERRTKVNKSFGTEQGNRPKEEDVSLKETPDMVNYLYGNITLDTFNKIKKLKALSKSPNEREAFQAYRKAVEMCKEHNLDFDRIPCYVKSQSE